LKNYKASGTCENRRKRERKCLEKERVRISSLNGFHTDGKDNPLTPVKGAGSQEGTVSY
jgi:hypothetical protein